LGLLILVLVVSITLLRRYAPASKDLSELVGTLKSDSSFPRMRKDAPIYSQVRRFCPDGRPTGSYPETGFEEVSQIGTAKSASVYRIMSVPVG